MSFLKKNIGFYCMILITFLIFTIVITALTLQIKTQNNKPNTNDEIEIITTTTIISDIVKHLIGDISTQETNHQAYQKINHVNCQSLMGIGVDPHNYKTKLSDRKKIKKADIVIVNGLYLEAKMISAFEILVKNQKLINIGANILENKLLTNKNSHTKDPHIWFNPVLFQEMVTQIKDRLTAFFTNPTNLANENIEKINNNYKKYIKELKELTENIKQTMQNLADKLKQQNQKIIFVTAHDAFSYLQQFLNNEQIEFEIKSIQGISTQTEASIQIIEDISNIIYQNKIKAIFVETSMSPDSLKSLKESVDKKGHQVEISPYRLYSDSLGNEQDIEVAEFRTSSEKHQYPHSSYIGAFLHNIKAIKEGLAP